MEGINIENSKQDSLKQLLENDDQDLCENDELKRKNLNEDTDIFSLKRKNVLYFNNDRLHRGKHVLLVF